MSHLKNNRLNNETFFVHLNPSHKAQMTNFIKDHQLIRTLPYNYNSNILDSYLDPDSKFPVLFGAFQRQTLLCTLGLWKWGGVRAHTIYISSEISLSYLNTKLNYGN